MKKNIELNNLNDAVKTFNNGLSKETGKADLLNSKMSNLGAAKLTTHDKFGSSKGKIELLTIDSLGIDFDFIKVDVEGMATEVLMGGQDTIKRSHPVIWIEVFKEERESINSVLSSLGYIMVEQIASSDFLFEFKT